MKEVLEVVGSLMSRGRWCALAKMIGLGSQWALGWCLDLHVFHAEPLWWFS